MGAIHQALLMYGASDLGAPGALVRRSADQTGTFPFNVNWNVDEYDPLGWHDVVTNQHRLTVPANVSLIRAMANFDQAVNSNEPDIQKNLANFYGMGTAGFGESSGARHCVTAPIAVTAGDYLSVRSGSLNNEPSANNTTWAAVEILPAATKYALVRNSTTTAHTGGTTIQPSWDTVIVDNGGWYSSGTPTRLTVPAGVTRVKVSCSIQWSANTNRVQIWIKKNGGDPAGQPIRSVGSGSNRIYTQSIISPILEVTPGDYFEVNAFTTSGRTIQANEKVWFSIEEAPNTKRCLATKSANQSIPASTNVTIQWDGADVYDTHGFHDPVTDNTKFIIPSGLGITYARVGFGASSIGTFADSAMWVNKNGAAYQGRIMIFSDPNSGDGRCSAVGPWVPVVAGDYFEAIYFQSSGTTHTFGAQPHNWFFIECI